MTLTDVIDYIDGVKPNVYTSEQKALWINALEKKLRTEVLENYEDAEDTTNYEKYLRFSVTDEKAEVTGFLDLHDFPGAMVIPEYYGNKKVTSIGYRAFFRCTGLTSITIPDSVTSIGSDAFKNCTGLTSITIPDSLTSIGNYAFQNCRGLTSITIPDSVTSIGAGAFAGCTGLTSITIPDSVTSVGSEAFFGCTGLTSVTIGNSVTSIGSGAFFHCTGLTSIIIPESVNSIGINAFTECNDDLTIFGHEGSYAETYADNYNIDFVAFPYELLPPVPPAPVVPASEGYLLIASGPYEDMYYRWVEAQIDYANNEIQRYNNALALFNDGYDKFKAWYSRTHTHKTTKLSLL